MASYTELIGSLSPISETGFAVTIPDDWMQGRTTYGGLTAALSLEAGLRLVDDMPIRSAQVAFVGPVGGPVELRPKLLRRGKNTAFVSVDLLSDDQVAAQSIFAFGKARESRLDFKAMPMPDVPRAEDLPSFFASDRRPNFTKNFNVRQAIGDPPISASEGRAIGLWMRFRDEAALSDPTAVLAIADCPPPAAISMFEVPAPISSMTWMAEFLSDPRDNPDRWWFALHEAQSAQNGYSSQSMRLWDSAGIPVLVGRQTIAVFA